MILTSRLSRRLEAPVCGDMVSIGGQCYVCTQTEIDPTGMVLRFVRTNSAVPGISSMPETKPDEEHYIDPMDLLCEDG